MIKTLASQNHEPTDNLINKLTQELQPVKALPHPVRRLILWHVFAVVYAVVAVLVFGERRDLSAALLRPEFILEMGVSAGLMFSAFMASIWLCVPDMRGQKWMLRLPLVFPALALIGAGVRIYREGIGMPDLVFPQHCAVESITGALLPMAVLVYFLRTGATTHPRWLALMSGLSAVALGWMVMRLSCGIDLMGHLLIYHFVPFLILGIVFGFVARRFYRW